MRAQGGGARRFRQGATRVALMLSVVSALSLVLAVSSGCASHAIRWSRLSLVAAVDANANHPVAVDLVLSADAEMSDRLAGLSAAQWFAQRETLQALFPNRLRYIAREVVPGQTLALPRAHMTSRRANAAFVFSRYGTPGVHRARIATWRGAVTVQLGPERIDVVMDR